MRQCTTHDNSVVKVDIPGKNNIIGDREFRVDKCEMESSTAESMCISTDQFNLWSI